LAIRIFLNIEVWSSGWNFLLGISPMALKPTKG
jgi:hypothetical protein